MSAFDFDEIAASLDRFSDVPDDVLFSVVTRDGLCFWAFDRDQLPTVSDEDDPDRALAARMCGGCPVIDECLELELRMTGQDTTGVWGAMGEDDRRQVHRVWKVRHPDRRPRGGAWE